MSQIPLSTADFAYALPYTIEAWQKGSRGAFLDDRRPKKDYVEAAEAGLQAVRELRRIERLPAGASALRERLIATLERRQERAKSRIEDVYYQQDLAPTWEATLAARYWRLARNALDKAAPHVHTAYRVHEGSDVPHRRPRFTINLNRDQPGLKRRPWVKWDSDRTLGVNVRHRDYVHGVVYHGLTVVEGHLVLQACPAQDFELPPGMRAIYTVIVARYREYMATATPDSIGGFEFHCDHDVVIVPRHGAPRFAPTQSAVIGALATTWHEYTASVRWARAA